MHMQEGCEKRHFVVLRDQLGGWLRLRMRIGAAVFKFQGKGRGTEFQGLQVRYSKLLSTTDGSQHECLPTPNPGGICQRL